MKTIKVLLLFLLLTPYSPSFAEYDGKYWVVRSGDTLYAIARKIYPGDIRQQAKLRREIIKLNQNVFAAGGGTLFVGLKLHMPGDVANIKTASKTQVVSKKPATKQPKKKPVSKLVANNQWRIKRGDTLYSIGRYFFPGSGRQQYRLRKEITQLNPDVFGKGKGRLEIGMLLRLPDYLVKEEDKPEVVVPVERPVERPVVSQPVKPVVTRPRPEVKVALPEPVEEQKPIPEQAQSRVTRPARVASASDYDDFYSLSIGYSFGGDDALIASGGHDISFGSGAHLRFNYDGLWDHKQGIRLGLGYQIDQVTAGDDSGELTQIYLQSMYIYNFDSSLIGIGLAYHDSIVFESDISGTITTFEPDAAVGAVVFYEYKRFLNDHIIGLAHSSLKTEDASGAAIDMSRTELYYRWQF